ncbi:MAG TPA: hypothetical protein PKH10_09525, partial [bacterium]|nr:hypothetical protein [bacterium]
MKRQPCARITCEVYQEISRTVLSALGSIGIRRPYIQSGRSIMLGERRGGLFSTGTRLLEDPIDIYSFTVPAERELAVMHRLIQAAMLDQEGRGSIYSEQIERVSRDDECPGDESPQATAGSPHYPMIQHLVGISCIVQRGQSDIIVRSALEMGICVPSVTFGIGAGLRDKLGLIRITIPAEKEVVNL